MTSRISSSMTNLWVLLSSTLLLFALSGCSEEDTTAPPPPKFDYQLSPTPESVVLLSGTAEYGSTVTLTRAPAFTAEEIAAYGPFELEADPFTAIWWVEAPLAADAENVFTATATDRKGNTSGPSSTTIEHISPKIEVLSVEVTPVRVAAGEPAVVTVTGVDNFGATVTDLVVTLTSSDDTAAFTDSDVVHTIAGAKTITATYGELSATTELEVVASHPTTIDLTLDAADVDGVKDGIQVTPDTIIPMSWVVTDEFGNEIDAPVGITTNAAGFVRQNELVGVTVTGTYDIVATVIGTGVSESEGFEVIPGDAAMVTIDLLASEIRAGEAVAFQTVVTDAWGNLVGESLEITTDAPSGTSTLDMAAGNITFTAAGQFTVTATALSDGTVTASADIHVRAAAVAIIDLVLGQSSVMPGTPVDYTVTATDSFGNPAEELIRVFTNAPGAIITIDQITNLSLAGSFTVWAEATGTGVSDFESLTVTPGTAASVDLVLPHTSQPTGLAMKYFVTVSDAFGNEITSGVTITSSDAAAIIDTAAGTIIFGTPGVQSVTADYNGLTDSESVQIFLEPDVGPPVVTIVEPAPGSVFAPGETVTVRVQASDDREISQIQLQIRGTVRFDDFVLVPSGINNYTAEFVVNIPNGAAYGDAFMTPAAYDTAGNVTVGTRRSFLVDPSVLVNVPNGASISVIAGGPTTVLNNPQGIDLDDQGSLYIANSGPQTVVTLDLATGTLDTLSQRLNAATRDVAYIPGGGVYVSVNDRIVRVDAAGNSSNWSQQVGNGRLRGLFLDGPNDILYAADDRNDAFFEWDTTATPMVNWNNLYDFNGNANQPWGVVVDTSGTNPLLYGTNMNNDSVWEENLSNGNTRRLLANNLNQPMGIALLPNGDLLVASNGQGELVQIALSTCNTTPCASTVIATGFRSPIDLEVDAASTLTSTTVYISDDNWDCIFEFTYTP